MRGCTAILIALISLVLTAAGAQERSAAIFDFELVDTSRDNQLAPHDAEPQVGLATFVLPAGSGLTSRSPVRSST
jgi:hypothetical protein